LEKLKDDNLTFFQIDPSSKSEVLMIFKESNAKPVLKIKLDEIPYKKFIETFESNKYLDIPRITSKTMFSELCPAANLK
jgi:hypothetical protein